MVCGHFLSSDDVASLNEGTYVTCDVLNLMTSLVALFMGESRMAGVVVVNSYQTHKWMTLKQSPTQGPTPGPTLVPL